MRNNEIADSVQIVAKTLSDKANIIAVDRFLSFNEQYLSEYIEILNAIPADFRSLQIDRYEYAIKELVTRHPEIESTYVQYAINAACDVLSETCTSFYDEVIKALPLDGFGQTDMTLLRNKFTSINKNIETASASACNKMRYTSKVLPSPAPKMLDSALEDRRRYCEEHGITEDPWLNDAYLKRIRERGGAS